MIVNRRELKYPIGETDYYKVNELFKEVLTPDPNNKSYGYRIRSLYFDSLNNDDYYAKVNGEEIRKKNKVENI
ncbi:VTC domain-containing protein [Paraclostridium bifermentans]|uniref:VTC domain-containing protein n=1 Tax=Paraclostridium bifermentans TaxID=1490 RepID=UPI0021C45E6D|nr:VTC domain-containing protein [Paraclostridium bifermentans]GKZ03724.1 hypothetical protein ANS014_21580 [Paraclostridium bifermentans]